MTGDKKDMGMMNETVDNGGGDDGIGKETAPFIEVKIAGQNKRAFFVSNGDELKKEIGLMIGNGGIAHFMDNNEVEARKEGQLID